MLIATTTQAPEPVLAALRAAPGILSVDELHG
jgi:hypothetical protein